MEARAEFSYEAKNDDELSFKAGDAISDVTSCSSDGWLSGVVRGRRGVFPDSIVKITKEKPPVVTAPKPAVGVPELRGWIRSLNLGSAAPANKEPAKSRQKAKVLFAYSARNADELSLSPGDIVEIIRLAEDGWYEGLVNGKTGLFPANFVEVLNESHYAVPVVGSPDVRPRPIVGGVGLGNIFGNEPLQLRKVDVSRLSKFDVAASDVPSQPVPSKSSAAAQSGQGPLQAALRSSKTCVQARVMYEYRAKNADELSLSPGETVNILDQNTADRGWWKGQLNGRIGVFPDSFVTLLSTPGVVENAVSSVPTAGSVHRPKPQMVQPAGDMVKPVALLPPGYTRKELPKLPDNRPSLPSDGSQPPVTLTSVTSTVTSAAAAASANRKSSWQQAEQLHRITETDDHKAKSRDVNSAGSSSNPSSGASGRRPSGAASRHPDMDDPETLAAVTLLDAEVRKIRVEMENVRREHDVQLNDLVGELDSAKKSRLVLQVEVDRLKKLIA